MSYKKERENGNRKRGSRERKREKETGRPVEIVSQRNREKKSSLCKYTKSVKIESFFHHNYIICTF